MAHDRITVPKKFRALPIKGTGVNVPNMFPKSLTGTPTRGNPKGTFVKANPNAIEREAVQTDTRGYQLSDADFAKRFPLLVQGRDYNVASAATNLTGSTDPQVQSALNQSGLGDVNFGQGEYNQARNMGIPIAAKEARDRNYFSTLLADNPQRAFGLNSQDIAHIAMANTNGQNLQQQGQFGSRLNQYVANTQQSAQNQAALIGGLGSIGASVINNPYLTSGGYGNNFGSGSVNAYNAASASAPGGAVGYNAAGQAGSYDAGSNFTTSDTSTSGGY